MIFFEVYTIAYGFWPQMLWIVLFLLILLMTSRLLVLEIWYSLHFDLLIYCTLLIWWDVSKEVKNLIFVVCLFNQPCSYLLLYYCWLLWLGGCYWNECILLPFGLPFLPQIFQVLYLVYFKMNSVFFYFRLYSRWFLFFLSIAVDKSRSH